MHSFEDNAGFTIFFSEFGGYDDMEFLFERFEKNLNAKVYDKIEGPYSKIWLITINGEKFKLVVDEDYGSMLVAEESKSIETVKSLINKIEKFIQ
jgi:hypothetical protein